NAACRILEITEGKPGVSRTITRTDLANMQEDQLRSIFDWCLLHFTGSGLEPLLEEVGLLGQPVTQLPPPSTKTNKTKATSAPKTNRFTRAPPKQPPPRHIPSDWPASYGPARISAGSRPSPAPQGPADGLKADQATPTAADPEQAPAGSGQGGD